MAGRGGASRFLSRREERFNAWLTVALLFGIVVMGNLLAERRLDARRDLSEDQLFTLSPATVRLLGRLEDRLQVRTYFTRETALGEVQLARARVEAQLDELRALARGRMEVVDFDPVTSTAARSDAQRAGLRAIPQATARGTETVAEDVWLGLVLRYRGREQAIPYAQPFRFEVQFASALHALVRDRRVVVGLYGATPPAEGAPAQPADAYWPTYGALEATLRATKEVRRIGGLEGGLPVPGEVDVVIAVASQPLHPRAVYELDRFVQRGGALVVAVDDPVFNWLTGQGRLATPTGPLEGELGKMLEAVGAFVWPRHVWDGDWATTHAVVGPQGQLVPVRSPAVLTLPAAGLSPELPPTRDLPQLVLWWAFPLRDAQNRPPPAGVVREDLARTSAHARLVERLGAVPRDARAVAAISESVAVDPRASYVLAAAFHGDLPSIFEGRPAPAALDLLTGASVAAEATPVPAGASPGAIIVVGDADWLRDEVRDPQRGDVLVPFGRAGGLVFAENLVDWLTLDEDLIALRSRVPRDRPLVDFVREARASVGLGDAPDAYQTDRERRERDRLEDAAVAAARRRRWWTILAPIAVALGIVASLGAVWNVRERRRPGVTMP